MTTAALKEQSDLTRAALLGKLLQRRESLGLTQAELAERIGVSRMTVQRAEAEGADMQLSSFISMSLGLNVLPGLGREAGEAEQGLLPKSLVHRGLAHNRTRHDLHYRDRQREAALAASWESVNESHAVGLSPIMSCLVPQASQDQATAAATAVQWLGSEVGFDFLQRALAVAGYEIVDKGNPAN